MSRDSRDEVANGLEGALGRAGMLHFKLEAKWLVAWRASLPDLACCTSKFILNGGLEEIHSPASFVSIK